jgi:anaerobic magnesium-protoporphyrin IX monomethyl ester cyclase
VSGLRKFRVLFVEPPKEFWFVMGEYLPPPLGILQLASYLESRSENFDIEVVDCQAERLGWSGLEKRIESFQPDIVAPSSVATCNAYAVLRTLEIAKKVNPEVLTFVGGQHFTALAQESLEAYPEIDAVVRGEGEETFFELAKKVNENGSLAKVRGASFKHNGKVVHNPPRPLITNLNDLPFPGYHFVEDLR